MPSSLSTGRLGRLDALVDLRLVSDLVLHDVAGLVDTFVHLVPVPQDLVLDLTEVRDRRLLLAAFGRTLGRQPKWRLGPGGPRSARTAVGAGGATDG